MRTNGPRFSALTAMIILGLAVVVPARQPAGTPNAARPGIDWPSFRGIGASDVADGKPAPTTFSPATALWKTAIAGLGLSSPVIWANQLCVTTAISGRKDAGLRIGPYGDVASVNDDTAHEWKVICLDKVTGNVLWERSVHKGVPAEGRLFVRTKDHIFAFGAAAVP